MRFTITSMIVLLAAVGLALVAQQDSGHIIINFRGWTIETSFIVFATATLICFFSLYALYRLFVNTTLMPRRLRRWRKERTSTLGRKRLTQGMIKLQQGQWSDAEKLLIKSARNADYAPLAYLGAATAAQGQGANNRRDGYLQLAQHKLPDAKTAFIMTQARLQADNNQFDQAIDTLKKLPANQLNTPATLQLLTQLYRQQQDWPAMVELLPRLRRYKVYPLYNYYEIEHQAYSGFIKHTVRTKDLREVMDVWRNLPKRLQEKEDIVADLACSLIHNGRSNEAEEILYIRVNKQWSEALVFIYGLLDGDAEIHLSRASNWLKRHKENPILLLSLGRLAMRAHQWKEARQFLEDSLKATPTAEAYKELGNLLAFLNEQSRALECYRRGLALSATTTHPALKDSVINRFELPSSQTVPAANLTHTATLDMPQARNA